MRPAPVTDTLEIPIAPDLFVTVPTNVPEASQARGCTVLEKVCSRGFADRLAARRTATLTEYCPFALGTPVTAPLNGTFYRSAGPGKPELAADGANVKNGEPCCIVEAMKLFNPIKATSAGKITFLAKHGEAVVKGQTLAVIEN